MENYNYNLTKHFRHDLKTISIRIHYSRAKDTRHGKSGVPKEKIQIFFQF